jgi:hypothetical protein
MPKIWKRIAFCVSLTLIAAAPGYLIAVDVFDISFDRSALWLAVLAIAAFWSFVACFPVIDSLLSVPYVRRTLRIGFIARFLFTLILPLSGMSEIVMGHEIANKIERLMPGGFIPFGPGCLVTFQPTFAITLVDGAIHSFILLAFMTVVWALQMAFCKRTDTSHGFPVATAKD